MSFKDLEGHTPGLQLLYSGGRDMGGTMDDHGPAWEKNFPGYEVPAALAEDIWESRCPSMFTNETFVSSHLLLHLIRNRFEHCAGGFFDERSKGRFVAFSDSDLGRSRDPAIHMRLWSSRRAGRGALQDLGNWSASDNNSAEPNFFLRPPSADGALVRLLDTTADSRADLLRLFADPLDASLGGKGASSPAALRQASRRTLVNRMFDFLPSATQNGKTRTILVRDGCPLFFPLCIRVSHNCSVGSIIFRRKSRVIFSSSFLFQALYVFNRSCFFSQALDT